MSTLRKLRRQMDIVVSEVTPIDKHNYFNLIFLDCYFCSLNVVS